MLSFCSPRKGSYYSKSRTCPHFLMGSLPPPLPNVSSCVYNTKMVYSTSQGNTLKKATFQDYFFHPMQSENVFFWTGKYVYERIIADFRRHTCTFVSPKSEQALVHDTITCSKSSSPRMTHPIPSCWQTTQNGPSALHWPHVRKHFRRALRCHCCARTHTAHCTTSLVLLLWSPEGKPAHGNSESGIPGRSTVHHSLWRGGFFGEKSEIYYFSGGRNYVLG